VLPPRIDVFDQQMHHEIAGVLLVVEVLQQEAGIAVMNVGNAVTGRRDREPQVHVKPFDKAKSRAGTKALISWVFILAISGKRHPFPFVASMQIRGFLNNVLVMFSWPL
jgi:hypothetical protein